jgi:carboxypeptidase C (cathepsin A)
VTFLPALSEAAAFHKKLAPELLEDPDARRKEVEAFAGREYATALLEGKQISQVDADAIAARVSRYTGIDVAVVKRHDLRIDSGFFRKELLREEGIILGRFDARNTGRDGDQGANSPDYDPSYSVVYGPFSATLNDYVRRDLGFESDLIYEILSAKVRPWDYGKGFVGQAINVLPKLASVMAENPALKVMVNCGYQDLATPYSGIKHSLAHLDVDLKLFENIEYTFYEGGHMMYTIEKSNAEWNRDVALFIENNSGLQ